MMAQRLGVQPQRLGGGLSPTAVSACVIAGVPKAVLLCGTGLSYLMAKTAIVGRSNVSPFK